MSNPIKKQNFSDNFVLPTVMFRNNLALAVNSNLEVIMG